MGSSSGKPKAYSFYVFIILAVGMLFIAVYYVAEALLILQSGEGNGVSYQLIMGLFGLGVSIYMFMRFRSRMNMLKKALPPTIITVIECEKCGLKSLRKFVKGDFVFKSVVDCGKCSEPMLITGIYAEKAKK